MRRGIFRCAATMLLFAGWPVSGQQQESAAAPAKAADATGQTYAGGPQPNDGSSQFRLVNNVRLVLVPAIVTDRAGRHIAGLTAADFTLKDNGKVHAVKFVQEIITPDQAALEHIKLPPGTYSNNAREARAPLRVVIILIDMLNSHFKDQVPARQQLAKYLQEKADPGTMVALLGLGRGGLRMYHDLTSDTRGLARELQAAMTTGRHSIPTSLADETADPDADAAFVGHGVFTETGSSGRSSKMLIVQDTLAAFRNIAGAYASIPGRKSLLWVTGGFPLTIDGSKGRSNGITELDENGLEDILPDYQRTWQALNDANIAVYPVDMHGLLNTSSPDASYQTIRGGGNTAQQLANYGNNKQSRLDDNIQTFQVFAAQTGGKAFYNDNDLAAGYRQAVNDSRSSYLLGYALEDNAAPGWHTLHADVSVRGARVRARAGFLVPKVDADHPEQDGPQNSDVQTAMSSPMDFTGIPLTVQWLEMKQTSAADGTAANGKKAASGKRTVKFQITVPPHIVQLDDRRKPIRLSLEFVALARAHGVPDAADFVKKIDGSLTPTVAQRVGEAGIKYDSSIELQPGYYNVRFVVRDNLNGKMGSVTAPIRVK